MASTSHGIVINDRVELVSDDEGDLSFDNRPDWPHNGTTPHMPTFGNGDANLHGGQLPQRGSAADNWLDDEVCEFEMHCHARKHRRPDDGAVRALAAVCCITVVFIAVQVTGGYMAHSLAIMTDAFHMLTDLLSFLISLAAIGIARRRPSKRFSFGYYRAEVLGALASVLIIWILTGVLVYLAVLRCIDQQFEVQGLYMLITAAVGLLFNLGMMGTLRACGGGSHGHSHGGRPSKRDDAERADGAHEHWPRATAPAAGRQPSPASEGDRPPSEARPDSSTDSVPPASDSEANLTLRSSMAVHLTAYPGERTLHTRRRQAGGRDGAENINVRAAYVHAVSDAVQSAGVLVAAVVIYFKPEYQLADPICTFVFSLLVLLTTKNIVRDSILVLMEATPSDVSYEEVRQDLECIPFVVHAHGLHLWSLTTNQAALAVHLAIEPGADAVAVMRAARRLMLCKYNLSFTTIQVEPYNAAIMSQCEQCLLPTQ